MNFQKKILNVMLDFKKRGRSIVLVSHNPRDVKQLCDRAMFLKDGSMDIIGEPSKILDYYKNYINSLQE